MCEEDLFVYLIVLDGFELVVLCGKFFNYNGLVYIVIVLGDLWSGLYVFDWYCNSMGFLYGGMVSVFFDCVFVVVVWYVVKWLFVMFKLILYFYEIVGFYSWFEVYLCVLSYDNDLVQVSVDLMIDGQNFVVCVDVIFWILCRL